MKTIKDYFIIQELVDKTVFDRYGERAWKFIDKELLNCLLILRKEIDKPITINNWFFGGNFTQRGLRHNMSPLVASKKGLYLSAHIFGKAVDFDVKGMTSVEVREWILKNQKILPCKIRLENLMNGNPINWVHLDIMSEKRLPKVYQFNV